MYGYKYNTSYMGVIHLNKGMCINITRVTWAGFTKIHVWV